MDMPLNSLREYTGSMPRPADFREFWDKKVKEAWDMDRDVIVFDGMKYCTRWFDPTGAKLEEMFYKLGYIDVLNFVEYITCPVMFGTGLMDAVIPPSAQFALYNKLETEKQHMIYPKHGHELNNFFENELLKFLIV